MRLLCNGNPQGSFQDKGNVKSNWNLCLSFCGRRKIRHTEKTSGSERKQKKRKTSTTHDARLVNRNRAIVMGIESSHLLCNSMSWTNLEHVNLIKVQVLNILNLKCVFFEFSWKYLGQGFFDTWVSSVDSYPFLFSFAHIETMWDYNLQRL